MQETTNSRLLFPASMLVVFDRTFLSSMVSFFGFVVGLIEHYPEYDMQEVFRISPIQRKIELLLTMLYAMREE